jgi:very-short-patch-repair endonuclease
MNSTIHLSNCIELIKSWFDKNCFQNIPEDSFFKDFNSYISQYSFENDDISLDVIGESLSYAMGYHCPRKMCKYKDKCGCSQMGTSNYVCIFNLIDYLYPYSTAKSVVAFNKSNLRILTGLSHGNISWKSFEPSSPIEEIMDTNLRDAKLPIIPQFQAYSDMHKYRLDFLLETNCMYKIGIECDGVEYHAKPGQYILDRQRDRYLQEHNIMLMRFSGPEIFNNINGCITEIDKFLWKIKNDQIDISKPSRTSYFGLE